LNRRDCREVAISTELFQLSANFQDSSKGNQCTHRSIPRTEFGAHAYQLTTWKLLHNIVHDEYVKCNLFNEYFASISNFPANDINKLPPFHFLTDHRLLPPTFDPFRVVRSLHPNKCKGFANLSNRILKICSQSLATPFSLLFNLILSSEVLPTSWKTATVIPIHKTGSQTVVQNYRPIALFPFFKKCSKNFFISMFTAT